MVKIGFINPDGLSTKIFREKFGRCSRERIRTRFDDRIVARETLEALRT